MPRKPDAKVESATLADLLGRPAARRTLVVEVAPGQRRSLTLKAVGRPVFDALIAGHPPRDTDRDPITGLPNRWNPDTFWPALVAASLDDPVLSETEVGQVWAAWSKADTEQLAKVAWELNEGASEVGELPKSSGGSDETPGSGG